VATRGEAHRDERGQPGDSVAAQLQFTGATAGSAAAYAARIADRYRLDDRVSEARQSTLWKAFDEVLGRPVCVRTFEPGFPRAAGVVAAARAACRVTDERLARVFDADVSPGGAYVVTEWPSGVYLDDLLAAGQLDVGDAARISADAAGAVAAAHAAGIAHLCLTPRSLLVNPDAGVKIIGLGVDAALAGTESPTPEEAALTDTRGLACLLYATLTGYWPGRQDTALPAAPHRDGRPYRPRQVRAGVPARIDAITCGALFEQAPGEQMAVTSPAQLTDLLRTAPYREPRPAEVAAAAHDSTDPFGAARPPAPDRPARPGKRRRALAAGGVLGALFVIDTALIGLGIMGSSSHAPPAARVSAVAPKQTASSRPKPPATRLLAPANAQAFDPYDSDNENNQLAPAAIDGSPSTYWHTFWYTTPYFGSLKPGTGLLLDMGRSVTITRARVLLGAPAGADVELRIGPDAASLSDMAVAAKADGVGGVVNLRPGTARRGRYVLVWFTKLPPSAAGGGVFQADVYDVAVYGH
jgi:hypothetical protein